MNTYHNSAITQAMQSVAEAAPKAAADPTRPIYHFRPPALWMNDPNGVIYHNGYYHLFYQHNPYGDDWGHIHWGHARSRDLVYWEHLPIALWPSLDQGEEHCFSGCAWVNGRGQPMFFYTSVAPRREDDSMHAEQWAALGDPEWITWEKHPQNPILLLANHGGPAFAPTWRDPFLFAETGRTFMVLGAELEDSATVALYEATDADLARWRYCGILVQKPKSELKFFECPNFFKLDGKWVLLTSPYRPVEFMVGMFDVNSLTFKVETEGVLDPGFSDVPNYYATNILFDDQQRCILLGWVRGFAKGHGWNGCLALPRVLTIDADGHPRQRPVPELQKLRGRHAGFTDILLSNAGHVLPDIKSDTLEIQVTFDQGYASAVGLKVRRAEDGQQAVLIRYDGQTLHVAGTETPLAPINGSRVQLHIFLDKSVLEVYANDGCACVTRIIYPPAADLGVEVFAEQGDAQVEALDVWEMQPIW